MAVMGFGGAGGIQCVSGMSEIGRLKLSCLDGLRKLIKVAVPTRWRGPIVGIIELPFFIFTTTGSWFSM
jgi:hypothetical protein